MRKSTLTQARDLLSLRAFKPSLFDIKVPLKERVNERFVMGVSLCESYLTLSKIDLSGSISIQSLKTLLLNTEEERLVALRSFANENNLKYAVLLMSSGFEVLGVAKNFPDIGKDRLRTLRYGMKAVIGEVYSPEKSYACVSNPKFQESLVFSYDQSKTADAVQCLEQAGLEVLRVTCGIYNTLDHLVNSKEEFLAQEKVIFFYSSGSLLMASIADGRFGHFEFKDGVKLDEIEPIVSQMLENFDLDQKEFFYLNNSEWELEEFLANNHPELNPVPAFKECKKGAFQIACHD